MNVDRIQWQTVDISSLSPDEWAVLKQSIIRDAHTQRNKVLRDFSWRQLFRRRLGLLQDTTAGRMGDTIAKPCC